jgi:hypothetical protein
VAASPWAAAVEAALPCIIPIVVANVSANAWWAAVAAVADAPWSPQRPVIDLRWISSGVPECHHRLARAVD